jgi:probable HAF family extracellular repeat protein
MRPLYFLFALGLSCAATPPITAQTYSIQDLGIPSQATFSAPLGINQAGQVVGYGGVILGGFIPQPTSYFLSTGGKRATLDFQATAIAGGESNNSVVPITGGQGGNGDAVLDEDNFLRVLGALPGDAGSIGNAVNASGEVAGASYPDGGYGSAFLYKDGNLINIGNFPGGYGAKALGINDLGDVVGEAYLANGEEHAFLYRGDAFIDLGTLPGTVSSTGTAVNNAQQVTGYALPANGVYPQAFLWSNGKLIGLGALPTGVDSQANGINSSGEVVGYSEVSDPLRPGHTISHGFLYSQSKMHDLNGLIPANSGWVILDAVGINDKGAIAASATLNGIEHALLLQPSASCCIGTPVNLTVEDGQGFFWDGGGSQYGRTALQVYKDYPSAGQNWTWQPVAGGFTICTLNTVCLSDKGSQVELSAKADVFIITNTGAVLDKNTGQYIQNPATPGNGVYLSTGPTASHWNFSFSLH